MANPFIVTLALARLVKVTCGHCGRVQLVERAPQRPRTCRRCRQPLVTGDRASERVSS
jgi:ribosomal protein S27E